MGYWNKPNVWKTVTYVVARIVHICEKCGKEILPGTKYKQTIITKSDGTKIYRKHLRH